MKFSSLSVIAFANWVLGDIGLSLPVDGAIKIDFDVYRGSHKADLSKRDQLPAYFVKRDGSATMDLENLRTFYMTELKIGGSDTIGVLVDTGSLDLWVMSHDVECYASSYSSSKEATFRNMEVLFGNKGEDSKPVEDAPVNKPQDEIKPTATPTDNKAYFTTIYLSDLFTDGPFDSYTATPAYSESGYASAYGSVEETNTCTQYGSFNTAGSDSFKVNSSADSFEIAYADGTEALGIWGYDDVQIGNSSVTVEDLSFAVVNQSSSDVGVLGIGLPDLETTYQLLYGSGYKYENLPLKMKSQGLIKKTAYSLYLAQKEEIKGEILFGAVDHAKYSGTLATMPVVTVGYNSVSRLEVVVDLISLNSKSNITVTENSYAALLDTGSTLSHMPPELLETFAELVGALWSSTLGAYRMPCPLPDSDAYVTLSFSGKEIQIPLTSLAMKTVSSLSSLSSLSPLCYLGVMEKSGRYMSFGDNILRHMYVVYDLEDLEISIAQVKYSNDTDIEVISSSIPSATRASLYSSTSLPYVSDEASATATISYATESGSSDSSDSSDSSGSGGSGGSGGSNGSGNSSKPSRSSSSRTANSSSTSNSSGSSGSAHRNGSLLIGVLFMLLLSGMLAVTVVFV